nr:PREDICTED: uncharacterized protein LOC105663344 [Megachile rotundata]
MNASTPMAKGKKKKRKNPRIFQARYKHGAHLFSLVSPYAIPHLSRTAVAKHRFRAATGYIRGHKRLLSRQNKEGVIVDVCENDTNCEAERYTEVSQRRGTK